MENKKQYPKDIGAVWSKESSYGEYLSIQVEIDGVKHNFTAFANKFWEPNGKKPKYTIKPPKTESNEPKQNSGYNTQPVYQPPKSTNTIKDDEGDAFPF